MSAIPVTRTTRRRPAHAVGQAKGIQVSERAKNKVTLFMIVAGVAYLVSSLSGQVMVEKARRDGISASRRAEDARKVVAELSKRLDALTSLGAVDEWARNHSFLAPDQLVGSVPESPNPAAGAPGPQTSNSVVASADAGPNPPAVLDGPGKAGQGPGPQGSLVADAAQGPTGSPAQNAIASAGRHRRRHGEAQNVGASQTILPQSPNTLEALIQTQASQAVEGRDARRDRRLTSRHKSGRRGIAAESVPLDQSQVSGSLPVGADRWDNPSSSFPQPPQIPQRRKKGRRSRHARRSIPVHRDEALD